MTKKPLQGRGAQAWIVFLARAWPRFGETVRDVPPALACTDLVKGFRARGPRTQSSHAVRARSPCTQSVHAVRAPTLTASACKGVRQERRAGISGGGVAHRSRARLVVARARIEPGRARRLDLSLGCPQHSPRYARIEWGESAVLYSETVDTLRAGIPPKEELQRLPAQNGFNGTAQGTRAYQTKHRRRKKNAQKKQEFLSGSPSLLDPVALARYLFRASPLLNTWDACDGGTLQKGGMRVKWPGEGQHAVLRVSGNRCEGGVRRCGTAWRRHSWEKRVSSRSRGGGRSTNTSLTAPQTAARCLRSGCAQKIRAASACEGVLQERRAGNNSERVTAMRVVPHAPRRWGRGSLVRRGGLREGDRREGAEGVRVEAAGGRRHEISKKIKEKKEKERTQGRASFHLAHSHRRRWTQEAAAACARGPFFGPKGDARVRARGEPWTHTSREHIQVAARAQQGRGIRRAARRRIRALIAHARVGAGASRGGRESGRARVGAGASRGGRDGAGATGANDGPRQVRAQKPVKVDASARTLRIGGPRVCLRRKPESGGRARAAVVRKPALRCDAARRAGGGVRLTRRISRTDSRPRKSVRTEQGGGGGDGDGRGDGAGAGPVDELRALDSMPPPVARGRESRRRRRWRASDKGTGEVASGGAGGGGSQSICAGARVGPGAGGGCRALRIARPRCVVTQGGKRGWCAVNRRFAPIWAGASRCGRNWVAKGGYARVAGVYVGRVRGREWTCSGGGKRRREVSHLRDLPIRRLCLRVVLSASAKESEERKKKGKKKGTIKKESETTRPCSPSLPCPRAPDAKSIPGYSRGGESGDVDGRGQKRGGGSRPAVCVERCARASSGAGAAEAWRSGRGARRGGRGGNLRKG
ncbi:hypothetical protein C8R47DRAFT_1064940 [Mycena vitilis]|nr:hypothetical protein C8R47DRAFT_1064940 [Mycena vitilis]